MKINKLLQLLRDNPRGDAKPVRMEKSAAGVDVYVYDVIDPFWGASAQALIDALAAADGAEVALHINSPGGDVFEGRAMAAAVVAYPGKVTAHVDGLAASAATYVALAANEVRITDGGMMMIHNGWTLAMGDKASLRKTADLLEQIDGLIAADYARHMNMPVDQVKALMDDETWYTPQQALEAGLVDVIDANTKRDATANASRWNLSAYANAPKREERPADQAEQVAAQAAAELQANRNRLRLLAHI